MDNNLQTQIKQSLSKVRVQDGAKSVFKLKSKVIVKNSMRR